MTVNQITGSPYSLLFCYLLHLPSFEFSLCKMASNPKTPTPLVVYVSFGEADCLCGVPHAPLFWGSGTEAYPIMLDLKVLHRSVQY